VRRRKKAGKRSLRAPALHGNVPNQLRQYAKPTAQSRRGGARDPSTSGFWKMFSVARIRTYRERQFSPSPRARRAFTNPCSVTSRMEMNSSRLLNLADSEKQGRQGGNSISTCRDARVKADCDYPFPNHLRKSSIFSGYTASVTSTAMIKIVLIRLSRLRPLSQWPISHWLSLTP
jgi:hypothetical protein